MKFCFSNKVIWHHLAFSCCSSSLQLRQFYFLFFSVLLFLCAAKGCSFSKQKATKSAVYICCAEPQQQRCVICKLFFFLCWLHSKSKWILNQSATIRFSSPLVILKLWNCTQVHKHLSISSPASIEKSDSAILYDCSPSCNTYKHGKYSVSER